jgi:acid phosphatase type 7
MGDIQYYASGLETYFLWFAKMAPMLRAGEFQPCIGNHEFERPTERADYVERYFGSAAIEGMNSWYRFHSGGVWFFALDTEAAGGVSPTSEQGKWFLAQLDDASKKPGYRFSIVYMHRPMATCGDVSENDTDRKAYQPTFEKLGVKLVLAGHLHVYERFEIGEVTYLTTGGGGAALMNPNANLGRESCAMRKSAGAFFHQVVLEVKDGQVAGTVIDARGDVRDTFTRVVP